MAHYEVIDESYDNQEEQERFLENVNISHGREEGVSEDEDDLYYRKRKPKHLYSEVWRKFTIVSRKNNIASCNVCGAKLSFKTTISNLKKHIIRKHNYDVNKSCIIPYQPKHKTTVSAATNKSKMTELGGLDGLILNVVADEGENPVVGEEVELSEVQDDVHDYCVVREEGQANAAKSSLRESKPNERNERAKKNNLMDMQLECLKLKKYHMQMETLLMEQQLNLPRSIHTENLIGCDKTTRGTQTDVGGGNIKVFYVKNNQGSGSHHLFNFQARLQD